MTDIFSIKVRFTYSHEVCFSKHVKAHWFILLLNSIFVDLSSRSFPAAHEFLPNYSAKGELLNNEETFFDKLVIMKRYLDLHKQGI